MKKIVWFTGLAVLLSITHSAFAQYPDSSSQVELIRDMRVDDLAGRQYALNKKKQDRNALSKYKTSGGKYKGYRLMVLNTNDRNLAYQTRGELATRFPQHNLYLAYQAPYYKLKMGDFLEKSEAESLKKVLSGFMKQGIFVVSDVINLKPEEEERLLEKISKGSTR